MPPVLGKLRQLTEVGASRAGILCFFLPSKSLKAARHIGILSKLITLLSDCVLEEGLYVHVDLHVECVYIYVCDVEFPSVCCEYVSLPSVNRSCFSKWLSREKPGGKSEQR